MSSSKLKTWCLVGVLSIGMAAGAAFAGSTNPFKGGIDGRTVPSPSPAYGLAEVAGNASHLGKYTGVITFDLATIRFIGVDPTTGFPIATLGSEVTFTAANGDQLSADQQMVGPFSPVDGNFPAFTFTADVTGGTGRFAGATGSYAGTGAQITLPGPDNDLVTATFSGDLSSIGSNKK